MLLALLKSHKAAAPDVVIVSISGHEIAQPIGELPGADHVIATRMGHGRLLQGRFRALCLRRGGGLYADGAEKEETMRRFAAGPSDIS
jgi:phosphoserine phosphatase